MFGGDYFAVTDAGGHYQGFITRENFQPYGWSLRIPGPFFEPNVSKDVPQRMPPRETDVLNLPPIELPRGVDVPGTVVDEAGHGISGATVEATWRHGTAITQLVMSCSDAMGRFVLHGVDPMAELTYKAWLGNSCTPEGTTAQAAAALTKPVVLTITPSASSTLYGRVLDSAGRPISDATVRIWRLGRGKDQRAIDLEPILSEDGRVAVRTDSHGRFRAPRRVPVSDEFFAEAMAPGRLSVRSRLVFVTEHGQEIPPVILPLVRTISGQVVDRQGQTVPDALVQQAGDGPMPTSATTDRSGPFPADRRARGAGDHRGAEARFSNRTAFPCRRRRSPEAGPQPRGGASQSRVQASSPGFIQGRGSRPRHATRSSALNSHLERGHRRQQAPDADETGGDRPRLDSGSSRFRQVQRSR